jgi:cardiolipin synthase
VKYRRALLLADLRGDPRSAVEALRRVAPALERLVVVARLPRPWSWWSSEDDRSPDSNELSALDAWRTAAVAAAPSAEVRGVPELLPDALMDLALTEDVDLLVDGARSIESASLLTKAARRLGVAVLWPAGGERDAPIEHLLCVMLRRRERASIAAFLRDHADPSLHVSVAGPAAPGPDALDATLGVLGIHASVDVLPPRVGSLRAWLDRITPGRAVDLLVLTHVPVVVLLGYAWPGPVLVVPPATPAPSLERPFDMTDLVDLGATLRARVDDVTPFGTLSPAADQVLALISEGLVVATVITTASGEVELPAGFDGPWLGVLRVVDDAPPDAVAAAGRRLAVIRPGERPLALFDAALPDEALRRLVDLARTADVEPLAVRLRPTARAGAIRQRLRSLGLPTRVVDARAVLDEGEALDVVEDNDPVRLRRVAARMRAAGFAVASVWHRGHDEPGALVEASALPLAGNRVEVELDNARARTWLLDAIAQSRESVAVQVYMALDDDVGGAVEAALGEAGARGVTVRVLVDSLHGLHGSFGVENPVLSRLAARPGVELRTSRPLSGIPSLTDIKQRDHRKIVLVDGRVALVGGRNLSHEYYTGFEEARLTADSEWREVPWLDAGARIEGPAVGAIAAAFLDAWTDAGGAPFSTSVPAAVGSTVARVVVHRGLRDARTLEAYLELMETARSHVYAVNGFPYVLEFQHGLLRALKRGVRVRVLSGHLSPTHDARPFKGAWSSARTTATELVHSRLDPIVEAGGEVYLFARRDIAGWDPALGLVHPHVHAKLMSVDGWRCAVGSANFDVTSSYWESELMLVVEDPSVAQPLERRLDELIAGSTRVDRDDPVWRERARGRSWMRRWPGLLEP